MSGPSRTLLVVAAALFDGDRRVLLQRRPAAKQHGGLWEFPGGKVEPGEMPVEALVRELAEELAIEVDAATLEPLFFSSAPGIVLLLYRCDRWTGSPATTEGATLGWFGAEELDTLSTPPADVPLLGAVKAVLRAPSQS